MVDPIALHVAFVNVLTCSVCPGLASQLRPPVRVCVFLLAVLRCVLPPRRSLGALPSRFSRPLPGGGLRVGSLRRGLVSRRVPFPSPSLCPAAAAALGSRWRGPWRSGVRSLGAPPLLCGAANSVLTIGASWFKHSFLFAASSGPPLHSALRSARVRSARTCDADQASRVSELTHSCAGRSGRLVRLPCGARSVVAKDKGEIVWPRSGGRAVPAVGGLRLRARWVGPGHGPPAGLASFAGVRGASGAGPRPSVTSGAAAYWRRRGPCLASFARCSVLSKAVGSRGSRRWSRPISRMAC